MPEQTPNNGEEPKKKRHYRKRAPKPRGAAGTSLQVVPKPPSVRFRSIEMSDRRRLFLAAYEAYCGNVTAACSYAGIGRRTFYRWIKSKSRINVKFRAKLALVMPEERFLDLAEGVVLEKVMVNRNLDAAKFVLDRKGRSRGYEAKPAEIKPPTPAEEILGRVVMAFESFLEARHPHPDTLDMWITVFARNGKVERDQLAAKVKELNYGQQE